MIGGVATRYMGGRFTGGVTVVGFALSSVPTAPALFNDPATATNIPGWNTVVTTQSDDTYITVNLPFNVTLSGPSTFNTVYATSNQYLMLGTLQSVTWFSFSESNPAVPKMLLNAADTSWNRVYTKYSDKAVTIRVQGGNTSGGGAVTVYEVTFFNPVNFSSLMSGYASAIQVVVGAYTSSGTGQGIYTSNTTLASRSGFMATGKNYLYLLDTNGFWTIQDDIYLQNKAAYDAGEYAYA